MVLPPMVTARALLGTGMDRQVIKMDASQLSQATAEEATSAGGSPSQVPVSAPATEHFRSGCVPGKMSFLLRQCWSETFAETSRAMANPSLRLGNDAQMSELHGVWPRCGWLSPPWDSTKQNPVWDKRSSLEKNSLSLIFQVYLFYFCPPPKKKSYCHC